MIFFDLISIILLAALLFWSIYNGTIIYAGIRHKNKKVAPSKVEKTVEFPRVSLIVPTKNEEFVIRRCLDGILNIDYPKDKLQVIVVDGKSTDGTFQTCTEFSEQYPEIIRVISEKTVKGKPAALNLALPYIDGDIVGVFDADSLPAKDVLRKAAYYFEDKDIMAIQGHTTSLNEKTNTLTRIIATEERAWFQALIAGRDALKLFVPLTGSCQFVRSQVVKELNGWDENSLTEDVEFALRLVEKNHLVRYVPDVSSGQETPTTLRSMFKQRTRWYRGYMETAIKYGRLLNSLNKRTIDAEISMGTSFMMVISLLSYINWFFAALFFNQSNPIINFTGLVIALTAVSLVALGIGLAASEKPIKLRNILWIPFIYLYWIFQMIIAGWALLKLLFRQKREWTKTIKDGSCS